MHDPNNYREMHDPNNYRELSKPFDSADEANRVIEDFMEEVRAIRQKYEIPDIHVIVRITALYGDAGEGLAHASAHFGDVSKSESMCAWALGRESAIQRQAIATLLKGQNTLAE